MSTASPVRPSPAARSEAFVAGQLRQAQQRIRLLDVTGAMLGFAILTMLYGLVMVVSDRTWELTAAARQLAFTGYLLVSGVYLGLTLVWPLCRRVNPYYAALQVERTIPNAKNSVVNWLDLHEQPLPASIRAAVSNKAAEDISEADLEAAISARRNLWLTGGVFALCVALLIQLALGGPQFFSLLRRAFVPFTDGRIATRTQLTLLKPEQGDLTVPVGRAVTFAVEARGRVPSSNRPDALRLLYRYHHEDPYEEQRLERGDNPGEWATVLPAFQVHNGFWYKIAGGDTETPEFRVSVRSTPLLTDFEATYRYRLYLGWKEQTTREPNLRAIRGTEVTLIARANRKVREATLELIEQKQFLAAERIPGEPQAMRFRFVLDRDGTFRIMFISEDDERNSDPIPYEIKVLPDLVPRVTLTQPGRNISLPINQKLDLRGAANDDFGLASVILRLECDKKSLASIPYPKGGLKPLPDGSHPRNVEYQESIAFDQLTLDGKKLKPGDVVEYWLEATDFCDYPPPGPYVGRSDTFSVTLTEPLAPPDENPNQRQQQQPQKDLGKNEKEREQQKSEAAKNDKEPPQPDAGKQDNPQQQPGLPQPDKGDKQPGAEQKPGSDKDQKPSSDDQKGEPQKDGDRGADQRSAEPQTPEEKRVEEQKQRLEQALKEQEKQEQNKGQDSGQPKPDDKQQSEKPQDQKQSDKAVSRKPDEQKQQGKPDGAKPDDQKQPGKPDGPKPDEQKQQGKPDGAKPDEQKQPGKPDGAKPDDQKQPGKPDGAKPDDQKQPGKPDGAKPDEQKQPGKPDGAKPDEQEQPGKPDGAKPDDQKQPGKPDGTKSPEDQKKGEKKPGTDSQSSEGKPGEKAPQQQPIPAGGDKKTERKPQEKEQKEQPKDATERRETKDAGKDAEQRTGKDDQRSTDGAKLEKLTEALKKVADQLKNADPKTQQELIDKAKELAKDPATRAAIEKALKEAAKDPAKREALKRMLQEAMQKTEANRERPQGEPDKNRERQQAEAKPDGQRPQADANRDRQQPDAGQERQQPQKPSEQQPKDDGAGERKDGKLAPNDPGSKPGLSRAGNRDAANRRGAEESPEAAPADPRYQKKAGELQLEDFKKRVTKDVLQKANMTEAEFQQFLKAYEEMRKRRTPEAEGAKEQLSDPKRAGGILKNQGPTQVKGGQKQEALQGGVQRHAPPEYIEKYNEFTQKLSNLKKDKDR